MPTTYQHDDLNRLTQLINWTANGQVLSSFNYLDNVGFVSHIWRGLGLVVEPTTRTRRARNGTDDGRDVDTGVG